MLLIDEIDKADPEFEAFLLEVLAENAVTLPELGTIKAEAPPVWCSPRTMPASCPTRSRALPAPVHRLPRAERELAIVRSTAAGRAGGAGGPARRQVVRGLRDLELRKAPSISETIDWARTLAVLGATELTALGVGRNRVGGGRIRTRPHARALAALARPGRPERHGPRAAGPRAWPRTQR